MAYCAASDVRLIIETTLTDAQIDSIITMSDAEIDARIAPAAGDARIKRLSMLITARTIMSGIRRSRPSVNTERTGEG